MITKKDNKVNPWIDYTYANNNMGSTGAYGSGVDQNYDPVYINTDPDSLTAGSITFGTTTGTTDDNIYMATSDTITISGNTGSNFNPYSHVYITDNTGISTQPDLGTKIHGQRRSIDVDELGDFIETLKRRMLILTPNFEMHEKYPMLKQLYDEYKAMEKLLSGPESQGEL